MEISSRQFNPWENLPQKLPLTSPSVKLSRKRESKTYKVIAYWNSGKNFQCRISHKKFTFWKVPSHRKFFPWKKNRRKVRPHPKSVGFPTTNTIRKRWGFL